MTTTPDDFLKSGTQSFETASNWSTGTVPGLSNDADIGLAATTTVNMNSSEIVNTIGIGVDDTLNINDVTFDVTAGTGANAISGIINVNNGSTINFKGAGVEDSAADIYLNGTSGDTSPVPTAIEISGSTTISGSSSHNGVIWLGGAFGEDVTVVSGDDDKIISDGKDNVALTLIDQTLKGAGTIGDSHLTLDNSTGSLVEADLTGYALTLDTGSNAIQNTGTLEAEDGGGLFIESPVDNNGMIVAAGTNSSIELGFGSAVSGTGTIDIGTGGNLIIDAPVAENVAFTGPDATLDAYAFYLGEFSGIVTGTETTDAFDIYDVDGALGLHAVWQQTSSSGGALSLYSDGTALATLNLAGQFNSLDFAIKFDGLFGELVTVQNTPAYAENPGNNDEWMLSDGNWVESAGPGSHPAGYNVAAIGNWTVGNLTLVPTDGILWFNPSTGDTDEWQLSNTQWSASVDLGSHPANSDGNSYQISAVGDFFDTGNDSVLWTSANSDGTVQTDIWELNSNGNWAASVSPGFHPAGYSVVGTGDWTGDGTNGILWYNSSTGDTDEWQLSNGQWANSVDLGSHPGSGWTIAGVGDFFDNGRDDVLWTNASGGSVQTDIWELGSNGQWINSVSPGPHPAGYQVAAVGDFTGTGTSDILWYDASTGDADEWLINNGQWAGSVDLGTHPGNFQIDGVGDFNGDGTKDILWHAPS